MNTNGEGGGKIQVQGRVVTFTDQATISADTLGDENGEGVKIRASQLFIRNGAQVSASPVEGSQGSSSGMEINALESVEVTGIASRGQGNNSGGGQGNNSGGGQGNNSGGGQGNNSGGGQGNNSGGGQGNNSGGGQRKPSKLATDARGTGQAGNLIINTEHLVVRDGGKISASTIETTGAANIIINATESVEIIGTSEDGRRASGLSVQTRGRGQAGSLIINTEQLHIRNGAEILASTFGEGDGGNIEILAIESLNVSGLSEDGQFTSRIVAEAGEARETQDIGVVIGTGTGGDIIITTENLNVQNSAQISASTSSEGEAGNLIINATRFVQLDETSRLSVESLSDSKAGDLVLTTGQLFVSNEALITVSATSGQAGNLTITADSLQLNNGQLVAETALSGEAEGANIILQNLDLLALENESLISATAFEGANGGNITIDSDYVVAFPPIGNEGSNIIANAEQGNGGQIEITTQGLIGIQFRDQLTPDNDITVTSQFGLAGDFIQNSPDVDPASGLTALPVTLNDATQLIDRSCQVSNNPEQQSSFTIIGRGGIPLGPTDEIESDTLISNWVTLLQDEETTAKVETQENQESLIPETIIEAQGWFIDSQGNVILTASPMIIKPIQAWFSPLECQRSVSSLPQS